MRLRNLLPTGTKLQLFKAAIFPYLTYSHLVCTSVMLVTVENWNEYRKGHSETFTLTDHQVMKNSLFNMANLCSLLNRRLQDMARLMYKVKSNICPKYFADLFQRTDTKYPLKNKEFVIPRFNNTITHGKHSIRYDGPKL